MIRACARVSRIGAAEARGLESEIGPAAVMKL